MPGGGSLTVAPSDATALAAWAKIKEGGPKNPQDLNRYTYTENNPILKNDPTGHCSGGSLWNNFVSVFNGTCMRKGMAILARGRTVEEKALGALAYAGPPMAVGAALLGTAGLAAPVIGALGTPAAIETAVTASAPLAKFEDYLLKPGATHGKDAVFRALGYGRENSAELVKLYEAQAATKFQQGAYTLGKLDEYGQRINIVVDVPGIGEAVGKTSRVISGWMIRADGSITLNTPFSGHP